jgi:hypothetical protein
VLSRDLVRPALACPSVVALWRPEGFELARGAARHLISVLETKGGVCVSTVSTVCMLTRLTMLTLVYTSVLRFSPILTRSIVFTVLPNGAKSAEMTRS